MAGQLQLLQPGGPVCHPAVVTAGGAVGSCQPSSTSPLWGAMPHNFGSSHRAHFSAGARQLAGSKSRPPHPAPRQGRRAGLRAWLRPIFRSFHSSLFRPISLQERAFCRSQPAGMQPCCAAISTPNQSAESRTMLSLPEVQPLPSLCFIPVFCMLGRHSHALWLPSSPSGFCSTRSSRARPALVAALPSLAVHAAGPSLPVPRLRHLWRTTETQGRSSPSASRPPRS